jgi:OOP family OmpA-OmpF porin
MIRRLALATALAAIGSTAFAQNPGIAGSGYVTSAGRDTATGAFGQCVRTGYWSEALAAAPCDATPRASAPPVPVAQQEPVPQVAAAPIPPAPAPLLEKVTLSSDVLFEFNKASLRPEGKQKLDELATRIGDANVQEIVATGHADRISSEEYNQKLSEERANAVKVYLADKGLDPQLVKAEGKGESEPVTGDACSKMGRENAKNRKLVQCLQPDRRVEIEVFGTREASGTGATGAGSGATTPGSGSSTSGSGAAR